MATGPYGVYRYYPPYYRSPRPRIATQPRAPREITLNDPAVLDDQGRRRHYYFADYDNIGMLVRALSGDFIMLDGVLSSSGGLLESVPGEGACCHIAAANDTTWVVISYTKNWSVS